jgi:hypothetical protein
MLFQTIMIHGSQENLQDTIATVYILTRGRSFIRITFKRQKQPAIPSSCPPKCVDLFNIRFAIGKKVVMNIG